MPKLHMWSMVHPEHVALSRPWTKRFRRMTKITSAAGQIKTTMLQLLGLRHARTGDHRGGMAKFGFRFCENSSSIPETQKDGLLLK
jgi:hypothetical protein